MYLASKIYVHRCFMHEISIIIKVCWWAWMLYGRRQFCKFRLCLCVSLWTCTHHYTYIIKKSRYSCITKITLHHPCCLTVEIEYLSLLILLHQINRSMRLKQLLLRSQCRLSGKLNTTVLARASVAFQIIALVQELVSRKNIFCDPIY